MKITFYCNIDNYCLNCSEEFLPHIFKPEQNIYHEITKQFIINKYKRNLDFKIIIKPKLNLEIEIDNKEQIEEIFENIGYQLDNLLIEVPENSLYWACSYALSEEVNENNNIIPIIHLYLDSKKVFKKWIESGYTYPTWRGETEITKKIRLLENSIISLNSILYSEKMLINPYKKETNNENNS